MDEIEKIKKEKMKELLKTSDTVEIKANDTNFEKEVIERSKKVPVVVDFWAVWCMPCLMISPALEKLAKEYKGRFILAKVNVDESRAVAQTYGIMSIPNVKMFKDGKVVDEFVGAVPEPMVRNWIERNI